MTTKAKQIIIPPIGVFRTVFLYVGQGDSAIMAVPQGSEFRFILLDNNIDRSAGGIDTEKLLKDLLDGPLDVFMNTHPHNDHTEGIEGIEKAVGVKEVWHSGHVPGKGHDASYQEMLRVIKKIGTENEYKFFGSNALNKIRKKDGETEVIKKLGDVDYHVFSPAEYLCEEIADEDGETRYRRIHEHCAVIQFTYGNPAKRLMMTGDADRVAWEEHIMDYHREAVKSDVLSAVHHGSRTFFKYPNNDEDIYEKHIETIAPDFLIVSAPKKQESAHDHPHDDAMALYRKHLMEENILHLGKNRESIVVDIHPNGIIEIYSDQELVKVYGYDNEKGDGGKPVVKVIGASSTRLDNKPMGSRQ